MLAYLDGHITVLPLQNLIFQIKILQVCDKFRKTYMYLDTLISVFKFVQYYFCAPLGAQIEVANYRLPEQVKVFKLKNL